MKQFVSELRISTKLPKTTKNKPKIASKSHHLAVSTPGLSVQSVGEIRHINYRPPRGQLKSSLNSKPKSRLISSQPELKIVGETMHEEAEKDPTFRPSQRTGSSYLDPKRWEAGEISQDSGFYSSDIGETGRQSPTVKHSNSWYSVAVNPVVVSKTPKEVSVAMSHTGLELEVDSYSISGRSRGGETEGDRRVQAVERKWSRPMQITTAKTDVAPFSKVLKGRKVMETMQPGVRFYMEPEIGRRPNHYLAGRKTAGK